jgi:hypothetical protein
MLPGPTGQTALAAAAQQTAGAVDAKAAGVQLVQVQSYGHWPHVVDSPPSTAKRMARA